MFSYDQLKAVQHIKSVEHLALRRSIREELRKDRSEVQQARMELRSAQYESWLAYETAKYRLLREYNGSRAYHDGDTGKSITYIDEELSAQGIHKLTKEEDVLTEEELVMSLILTQIEMEDSLNRDYDSVLEATHNMNRELVKSVTDFDQVQKNALTVEGSWFNKHREALEQHEQALHITLDKVRNRVQEGYSL